MSADSKRVSDAIKPYLVDALTGQAFVELVSLPGIGWFFALPVVSSVSRYIIRSSVAWAVDETAIGLSLLWIQIDLAYEVSTAEEAAKKLRDMIENPQKYSEEEQRRIDEYFDESTVRLIQLSIKRL